MNDQKVNERFLTDIWKRQLIHQERVVTTCGRYVEVVFPGRVNRDRGPDFIGAVVSIDSSELVVGDVELHVSVKDWKLHGHQYDPHYNNLVLHVVWSGDGGVMLQSGRAVSTMNLQTCLQGSFEEVVRSVNSPVIPKEACYDAQLQLGDREMGSLLDKAGEARFRLKASYFATGMIEESSSQVLYKGIMGAIGYTKNKIQFEELARRLPLEVLEGLYYRKKKREQVLLIETGLLDMAGLSRRSDEKLPKTVSNEASDEGCMHPSSWRLFRVRPGNHPARRIAGVAHLLTRATENGGLMEYVISAVSNSGENTNRLEACFIVRDKVQSSSHKRILIGQGRAREIIINIVLPFIYAWAKANSRRVLAQQAITLYRNYGKVGENGITREMEKLLLPSSTNIVHSAQRQQGLLHIAKTFCYHRRCTNCPIFKELGLAAITV